MTKISIPASIGEVIDKITILEIKEVKTTDPKRLANITRELNELWYILNNTVGTEAVKYFADLEAVNWKLWDIEDQIRQCEREGVFDHQFVSLARSVYIENDERARLKRLINEALGSDIIEEKIY